MVKVTANLEYFKGSCGQLFYQCGITPMLGRSWKTSNPVLIKRDIEYVSYHLAAPPGWPSGA
jgi:hypothetical protein